MSNKDNKTMFEKLERFNAQIDVWIDDEDYNKIEESCKLENNLVPKVKSFFQNTAKPVDRNLFKLLLQGGTYLKGTSLSGEQEWQALLWAKYLRAQIQKQGTDDFSDLLDDVAFFLQKRLPEDTLFFQQLYYQEISACARPGEESLGAADRAYSLVLSKQDTDHWRQSFGSRLYLLWARLNKGIGYQHSKQLKKAEDEFNNIIHEFDSEDIKSGKKCQLWKDLILYPAILNKAELQEELQFSYHTLETLKGLKCSGTKGQRKLIKEALAYRDMGRLEEAEQAFAKLLGRECFREGTEKVFKVYGKWLSESNSTPGRNIATQCLQALLDYYIAKLEKRGEYTTEVEAFTEILRVDFKRYRQELRLDRARKERAAFYPQLTRYLSWLADNSCDEPKFRLQFDRLHAEYKKELQDLSLEDFEEYPYNVFSLSMENCYKELNGWKRNGKEMPYKDDELKFLEKLNQFEKERNLLSKFKQFERELRTDCVRSDGWADCDKIKEEKPCFTDNNEADKAFGGLLNCSKKDTECTGPQKKTLLSDDYDIIIKRENRQFLDRLEYRSKHPRPSGIVESYHFFGLQRWNSQTPTLTLSPGGGYFLYRQDSDLSVDIGIAIDPGFDFIDNLFHMGFTLNDIDFVLITHAHLDHMRDLEPIISSLFELKKQNRQSAKNKLHVIMTRAVYHRVEHVITSPVLREFLADTYIVDIDGRLDANTEPVTFKFRIQNERFVSLLNDNEPADLRISAKRAYHNDFSDCSDAFGYVVDFMEGDPREPVFSFGYTGDTKYNEEIASQYTECHAVCVHLGSVKEGSKKMSEYQGAECKKLIAKKGHPYLFGLLRLIKDLNKAGWNKENRILLLSEFGEEMKDRIRIDLVRRLNVLMENRGIHCLPVDIGLNIMLAQKTEGNNGKGARTEPVNKVWCFGCGDFVEKNRIELMPFGHGRDEALFYFCDTCLKGKPDNVIQEIMHQICESGITLERKINEKMPVE